MFRLGSIFIPVTNLDQSIAWYQKTLEAILIDEWDGSEKGASFFFPEGDMQLGLIEVEQAQPTEFKISEIKSNPYYNYIVQDIDRAYHHLLNQGVEVSSLKENKWMSYFDFFDLDGNAFSVVYEKPSSSYHEMQRKQQKRSS
ncbi:VOC family protein [Halobacillus rhizosphaerae]|uniref:VOC family protein n=1 Tax=Halobacillus rhizosphaerae TaxID=3064889 RepID=UPI00398ABCCF